MIAYCEGVSYYLALDIHVGPIMRDLKVLIIKLFFIEYINKMLHFANSLIHLLFTTIQYNIYSNASNITIRTT